MKSDETTALVAACLMLSLLCPHVPCTQPYPYLHRAQMYIYLATWVTKLAILQSAQATSPQFSSIIHTSHLHITTFLYSYMLRTLPMPPTFPNAALLEHDVVDASEP